MDQPLKTSRQHSTHPRTACATTAPQAPLPSEQTRRAQEIRQRLRTITKELIRLPKEQVLSDQEMKQKLRAITKEICHLETKIYLGERDGRYNSYEWLGIVRCLAELNDAVVNTDHHLDASSVRYDTHEWRGVRLCLAELNNTVERIDSSQPSKKAA